VAAKAAGGVSIAASNTQIEYERKMQACQATNLAAHLPSRWVMPIYWYAACVLNATTGACVGGSYPPSLVWEQVRYLNRAYNRHNIMFTWDGIIHRCGRGTRQHL
jgi:hypothetical protein